MIDIHADDIFGPDDFRVDVGNYNEQLQRAVVQETVRREAKRRVDGYERPAAALPVLETLEARLARPKPLVEQRIDGWAGRNDNVLISAQFKSGKTTAVDNLTRCLLDGDAWLGQYMVTPVSGRVLRIDLENGDERLDRWLSEQGIKNRDRVIPLSLKGRASAFNPLDDSNRAKWAQLMRAHNVEIPILDCIGPLMDVLGLDENREAGRVLQALDALRVEAGTGGWYIVHHMGHNGERARGDSKFRGWPDVEWRIVRQDDNPGSPRFIAAYGRDVDIPESQLQYDAESRRLTILGGSRHDQKLAVVLDDVRDVIAGSAEPMTGRAIKRALADSDHSKDTIDAALRFGVRTDALLAINGPRNSKLYSSVRVSGSVRAVSGDSEIQCPSVRSPYRGRTLDTHATKEDSDAGRL